MSSVLAIDLAPKHTGVCYIPSDWNGDFYLLRMGKWSRYTDSKIEGVEKFMAMKEICQFVGTYIDICKPDAVVMEGYAFMQRSNSAHVMAEFGGVLAFWLWQNYNIVLEHVIVSQARRAVVGKIRRGKLFKSVKDTLRDFFTAHGFYFGDEDVIDAFVVGYYKFMLMNDATCIFSSISEEEQRC